MTNAQPPRRLVSLVPSTTASVCALGAGARLVGCTRYCVEPADALAAVPRVGGTKNPKLAAIEALQPDLVLANAEENRPEDLAWLAARVPMLVQTPRTVAEAAAALAELAQALGVGGEVAARAAAAAAPASTPRPLRAYYAIWRKPWMTVNADTYVHDVMARSGFANVAADAAARYPEMTPQEAVARGVEVVLLASEPWTFDEAQRAELAAERAFGDARLALCDGRDFSWHGVQLVAGLAHARALRRSLG